MERSWTIRFLRWFCPPHLLEEIEGDLLQKFEKDSKAFGGKKAKRRLMWNTIRFFRPGILLRNNPSIDLTFLYMFSNYIKVALRFMMRNKTFSAINISGLALGITGSLLLFLWIAHELSFEQFHKDKDQLYMAWNRASENGGVVCWETTPRVLAPTLKEEFTAVESTSSYASWGVSHLFTVGDKKIMKTSGVFVDSAFLTMLSFPLVQGNAAKAFENPNSIVITEKFARLLFDDQEAFGETVRISQSGHSFDFTVAGVMKDLPPNTDFKFEYLLPFGFLESLSEKDTFWGNNSVTTLVKLKVGHDINDVNESIKDIEKKHYAEGQHIEIFLYPLTKMRLYSRFENGVVVGGRIEVVRILGILSVCLLVIASINFINLSTARAQRRSKEVAVRKVTGAVRHTLIIQFLCEAILMAAVAGVLSLLAAYLLIPFFNVLIGQQLSLDFGNLTFWLGGIGLVLVVGILAGSYPALFVSSFRPVQILKGFSISSHRNLLRTMLVVFQFGFAVTLIVSAIVIRKQIIYVQNRDAGYSQRNLVYVSLTGDLPKNFTIFRNELVESGTAVSVTQVSAPITEQWSSTGGIGWRGKHPENRTDFERLYIDNNPSGTFGLTMLQGRDFDLQHFANDSTAAILNETALKVMGFDHPIGEIINDNGRDWHVIGVVKDFVFTSPFKRVEPIVLFSGTKLRNAFNVAYVKLSPSKPVQENIEAVHALAIKYNPEYPFEYQFADQDYASKFENMRVTLLITTIFTSIAIFIACLGLLGLAAHMAEARVKEIGIRKVLGGTVINITQLLSYASVKPILIAVAMFIPLSWFLIDWWLQSFVYRVPLDIWVFLAAAFSLVTMALITISTQTIRAARSNPIDSLRNE
jgi:putative ABC transport system permease protein